MEQWIENLKTTMHIFSFQTPDWRIHSEDVLKLIAHIERLEAALDLEKTINKQQTDDSMQFTGILNNSIMKLESQLATYKAVVEKAEAVDWGNVLSQIEYITNEEDAAVETFLKALRAVKEKK